MSNNNRGNPGKDGSGRLRSFQYFPLKGPLWKRHATPQPGQPKLHLLSRHHSQDMPAAYNSSNIIIKNKTHEV